VIVLLLVLGAAIVGWYFLFHHKPPPAGYIKANGTIEATEVDVSAKVSGHLLTLTVDEGSPVQEGQVIATLDGAELQAQVNQAQGAYASAQANLANLLAGTREEQIRQGQATLAQAQAAADGAQKQLALVQESYAKSTELKAQVDAAQASYDEARRALQQAQARRDLTNAGTRPDQVQAAQDAVAQAQAQATVAAENEARAQKLFEGGAISAQALDAAIAARDTANGALAQARATLADLQAGARPEEKAEAQAAVQQAQATVDGAQHNLDAARQLYTDRLTSREQVDAAQTAYDTSTREVQNARAALDLLVAGPTAQTILEARGQMEQAAGALKAAQDMTQYLTIRAPVSGYVLVKSMEVGELAVAGRPIVRLADLRTPWVRVYVPITNLRVRLGDEAQVTTDAYPGQEYYGSVTEVADQPEFTPKNVQTVEERVKLVFGVKIELKNPRLELKPGMPADAIITLHNPTAGG
jgi:HlyD family secretion protein